VTQKQVLQILAAANNVLMALPLQVVEDLTLAKATPGDMAAELGTLAPTDIGKFLLSKRKQKKSKPSFAAKSGAATEKLYRALSNSLDASFAFHFGLTMKGNPLRPVGANERRQIDSEGRHYLVDVTTGAALCVCASSGHFDDAFDQRN
jgi:hypothetical protein